MKLSAKRLGVAAAALLALIVAAALVEHVRGRWAFDRRLSALEARGEVLSIAALEPQRPSRDQNCALALMSLSNRLETVLTNAAAYPPSGRFAAPGRLVVSARLTHWSTGPQTSHTWADVQEEITRAREVLTKLRAVADLPAYDSGFDYRKGFVDFQLAGIVSVKRAVQVLHHAALLDLHAGHLDSAHANLRALIQLAVNQRPEPLVICQLVRQACVAIAFNATWQALQSPGWTEPQLSALQWAWTGCDLPGDLGKAFEMERAMGVDFYRQLSGSYAVLKRVIRQREDSSVEELMGSLPTQGFWLHYLHLPCWRVAWLHQDALRSLEQWELALERERLARSKSWSALPSRPRPDGVEDPRPVIDLFKGRDQLGPYDRLRYLFSAESFLITDALLRKTLSLQTQQQMVLTAIAAARHRAVLGHEPPALGALVPRFLPVLPRDWMNGEPLRYQGQPGGGFLLYSVGEDGRDNHGDPSPSTPRKKYRQLWDGRDAVWPVAATEAEAEAAVASERE